MERNPPTSIDERRERILFLLLAATSLVAVWRVPVFLTQDGPSHLYNARILLELWGNDAAGYGRFFTFNTDFSPNWTGNLLLAGSLRLFPAVAAEKVLVSGYLLLLAFGFRNALRTMASGTPWLSVLAFVFVFNFHLLYGFYNFCLGLAILFWAIAAWHRFAVAPSRKAALVGGALMLLLAFTHPVPLVVGLLWAGIVLAPMLVRVFRTSGLRAVWPPLFQATAALLPAVLFFIFFLPPNNGNHQGLFVDKLSTTTLKDLLRMEHLLVFPHQERPMFRLLLLAFVVVLVAALIAAKRSRSLHHSGLLVLLLASVLVYFFVSDELAGGAYLTSRMALIVWMVFGLWAACSPFPQRAARPLAVGIAIVALALGTVRHVHHRTCAEVAAEHIAQLKPISAGAVVLPLCFSPKGETASDTLSPRIGLFKHMSGYAAADQRFISLDNYEANTAYFQTKWHPHTNPFTQLCPSSNCDIEGQPGTADVGGYEQRSGLHVDMLALWGAPSRMAADTVFSASPFCTRLVRRDR